MSDPTPEEFRSFQDTVNERRAADPDFAAELDRQELAWNILICAAYQWTTQHMDQFDKFKFDTQDGPVYVSLKLETQYPDSFESVEIPPDFGAALRADRERRAGRSGR